MNYDDGFDFNGPLPPDVPDGAYRAKLVSAEPAEKPTKDGGAMFFLRLQLLSSDGEEQGGVGKHVTAFFMPKKKGHPRFRLFAQDVQALFGAFGESPPSLHGDVAEAEVWKPLLAALVDHECQVDCRNEVDKTGVDRVRVKFVK